MKLSFSQAFEGIKNKLPKISLISLGLCLLAQSAQAGTFVRSQRPVRGQYIVIMKNEVQQGLSTQSLNDKVINLANDHRARIGRKWQRSTLGFTAKMNEIDAYNLSKNENVALVEEDSIFRIQSTKQYKPDWGLDRIDQLVAPIDYSYSYDVDGTGVDAYIFDTGIRSTHNELKGRVLPGFTAYDDTNKTEDCNGHGTHVAGIVGGTIYGVAKNVNLIPVRIMDCGGTGYSSDIISGLEWVIGLKKKSGRPSIVNLSVGGFSSTALEQTINNAIKSGIVVVVAAGNFKSDACDSSPARVRDAITVGATTGAEYKASFSNWGSCVDLFAPGYDNLASGHQGDNEIVSMTGTSVAAPFVSGAAALYLTNHPKANPAEVAKVLISNAAKNVISEVGKNSPNLFLYTGFKAMGEKSGSNTPDCSKITPILDNGGFERGALTAWKTTKNAINSNNVSPARSGLWKAALNGTGKTSTAYIKQTISIPATACSAKLSFWKQVITKESATAKENDLLTVTVAKESGANLVKVITLSNRHASNEYTLSTFDLSAYKGSNVVITFTGKENSSKATSFLIDDVSVEISE